MTIKMISKTFNIIGMTSGDCCTRLEQALNSLPNVTAQANLGNNSVKVNSSKPIDQSVVVKTIEQAGFSVKFI